MVKKAFAIASVTALTGMVVAIAAAGCTSNDEVTPVEDGGSQPDVRKPPPPDADDDDGDGDGGDVKCFDEKPLDVSGERYQPPRIQPGACTENVLAVIDDLAAKPNATFDELKAAIVAQESTVCAECVFGEDGDTWAPIVEKEGRIIAVNGGGCVDLVSEKADCGKAYYHWDLCLDVTCSKCTGSEAKSCFQEAQSTACKGASEALVAACGGTEAEVNKHLSACFKAGEVTVKGPIREQCIKGGEKDASTD